MNKEVYQVREVSVEELESKEGWKKEKEVIGFNLYIVCKYICVFKRKVLSIIWYRL